MDMESPTLLHHFQISNPSLQFYVTIYLTSQIFQKKKKKGKKKITWNEWMRGQEKTKDGLYFPVRGREQWAKNKKQKRSNVVGKSCEYNKIVVFN